MIWYIKAKVGERTTSICSLLIDILYHLIPFHILIHHRGLLFFTARQDIFGHSPKKQSTTENNESNKNEVPPITATFTSPTSFLVHRCHNDQINDVLATYNGQIFITAGADANVNVFESLSGRLQKNFAGLSFLQSKSQSTHSFSTTLILMIVSTQEVALLFVWTLSKVVS